ncbi:1-aminocyclopropane-1-carboxylate oxidase 5 [Camellia lanceoleosa]|uniref:1-aminocyclopropane-1-carboxylate oxidase 5 n=1 Tax=Camellia lanceoleosa TaxID=1840588 RepID=A0ACC0GSG6_9ERIC|nr:1-aminocyclopropane-1-carboxylate oxidase 5 [Camellia lanceoleosa]
MTEPMEEYRSELKKLAEKVMEVMDENLGLPKEYIKKAFNGGYGENAFFGTKVRGLQIHKDGEWIDVQPLPNAIVINTGDQIEVLSNGLYKSVWHRVLPIPGENRRSIASFYNPSLKATIAPAPELVEKVDQEVDQAYPKFVFGDYMSVYAEQKFLPKEPRFHAVKAM